MRWPKGGREVTTTAASRARAAARPRVGSQGLGRLADWGLAGLVVAVVGMIIVPLPTFLIDILISANFTLAVALVLLVVTIGEPRRFAAFPTVLLLSTLYRLALNVSSTRLILLQADAGDVIRSFGQAVVRGNFVVGVIVFLVITVVQYVVIARGAERVAEVAARFALDALPGKQLAIDADLRAGVLRGDDASRRRGVLERESQLYGAMDGAMKLVKGDAIAGILITIVSVVGGLVIGVGQRGLGIGDAFRTYALLAIGDALVSQIPALLCAMAAGLLVTRVAGDAGPRALGGDIVAQVLAEPRALWAAAGGITLLGLVPGLPALPFLLLAGVTALVARAAPGRAEVTEREQRAGPPRAATVEIGGATAAEAAQLERSLTERMYDELGVLAGLAVVLAPDRSPGFWRVRLGDVPVAEGRHDGNLVPAVLPLLHRHAAELLGLEETERLVRAVEKEQPALVREVVPRLVSLPVLAEVLGRLVAEGVSVRDLRTILGALARAPRDAGAGVLVERTRAALRRQITHQVTRGNPALAALRLDDDIEDAIREAVRQDDRLALEPELRRDIVLAVGKAASAGAGVSVLVAPAAIRRHARDLLAAEHPGLAVVAYDELLPDVTVETTTVSCAGI